MTQRFTAYTFETESIKQDNHWEIERAELKDAAGLAQIEASCFPAARTMGLSSIERILRSDDALAYIARSEESSPVGYIVLELDNAYAHIVSLGVIEVVRRRGVGSALLQSCIEFATHEGCLLIYAEIRQSNEASRALFETNGFARREVVKNYYGNPSEDAVIYQRRCHQRTSNEAV